MPRIALASLLILLGGADLAAQESLATTPRDSLRARRSAYSEQARFEMIRRRNLPEARDEGGGSCDPGAEIIGRFCLTFDDGADHWSPPPEVEEITVARTRLLERLAATARVIPGDAWVTGQRVRYLVEARRFDDALAAARECRAASWWCSALAGFASHFAGDPGPADSAFSAMLADMPARERRQWTDLSLVLEPCALGTYRRLKDDDRDRFERRFWRISDPFFARPGNDLRSEHLARNVMDQLQDRAKSTENISWGNDLREILIRYGYPVGWERLRQRIGSQGSASLRGHYSNTDQQLLPSCETLRTGDLGKGEWDVENPRPQAGYSLPLGDSIARWIYPLDHQVAVFRRGDSAVIVAVYALPPDSIPAGATVNAALAVARDGDAEPSVSVLPRGSTEAALRATVEPGPMLVSLELVSEDARRAARSRRGISVAPLDPARLTVSDLLLLRASEALPDSLGPAMQQARGSNRLRPGEEVGVYWEVYGLQGQGPNLLTMSLRLLDRNKGLLRRMAERMGIVRDDEPIRMQWKEEPAVGPGLTSRALTVQIPPDLPDGTYTLELSVELIGGEPAVVQREIRVVS